jgi:hypothetical protein
MDANTATILASATSLAFLTTMLWRATLGRRLERQLRATAVAVRR